MLWKPVKGVKFTIRIYLIVWREHYRTNLFLWMLLQCLRCTWTSFKGKNAVRSLIWKSSPQHKSCGKLEGRGRGRHRETSIKTGQGQRDRYRESNRSNSCSNQQQRQKQLWGRTTTTAATVMGQILHTTRQTENSLAAGVLGLSLGSFNTRFAVQLSSLNDNYTQLLRNSSPNTKVCWSSLYTMYVCLILLGIGLRYSIWKWRLQIDTHRHTNTYFFLSVIVAATSS